MKLPQLPKLPPFVAGRTRFVVVGVTVIDTRAGKRVERDADSLVNTLNALDAEICQLRYEDAEWWTLAAGKIALTPDAEAAKRVKMKCDTLLAAFYERGKRAGRAEAAEAAKKKTPAKRGSR